MKKLLIALPLLALTACNTTTFKHIEPNGAQTSWTNCRMFWQTERYSAALETNGTATLECGQSKADSEGLGVLIGTAVKTATK